MQFEGVFSRIESFDWLHLCQYCGAKTKAEQNRFANAFRADLAEKLPAGLIFRFMPWTIRDVATREVIQVSCRFEYQHGPEIPDVKTMRTMYMLVLENFARRHSGNEEVTEAVWLKDR